MDRIKRQGSGARQTAVGLLAALAIVISACSASLTAPSPDVGAATEYCNESRGTVETRQPYWNTNTDQSAWLQLPGSMELCWFETLDDEDKSRIYLDLNTLYSKTPTLAAAAYLAKIPLPDKPTGNPADVDCHDLNASADFGNTLSGGGWVNLDDPDFTVVNLCVFPDGSAIDAWGIAYYSGGTSRGIDLAGVFRFDQDRVPSMFQS